MKITIETDNDNLDIKVNDVSIESKESKYPGLENFIRHANAGSYGPFTNFSGIKINLIKAYREITQCGLKEAKDEVYRIIGYVPPFE